MSRIKWHIETRKLTQLVPYSKNPRIITEAGLKELKGSLDEIGYAQPININTDNTILSGHARYYQLKSEDPNQEVEVLVPERKLTDKEEEAVVIRMNKNIAGSWDFDILGNQFELDDLTDWGFSEEELSGVDFDVEKLEPQCDEDEVPEIKDDPITKRGDVWLLGYHRVMCGDSTMIDDVEKLLQKVRPDFVYTDPPYGITLDTDYSKMSDGGYTYKPVANDDKPFDPCFILDTFHDVEEIFIWGAENFLPVQSPLGSWVVWDKSTDNSDNCFFANPIELCWSKRRHKYGIYRKYWRMMAAKEPGEKRVHPTQKPIDMAEWFFEKYVPKKSFCLDLFLGSGSTLIACEKTNRKCFGMELDEHYCDVIINRWQNYTGKEAVLESNNKTYNELRSQHGNG